MVVLVQVLELAQAVLEEMVLLHRPDSQPLDMLLEAAVVEEIAALKLELPEEPVHQELSMFLEDLLTKGIICQYLLL